MTVSTDSGDFELNSREEVINFMQSGRRPEFWISGAEAYPCLAVCVSGDFAAVNFFRREGGEMSLSYNRAGEQEVTFTAGGEKWTPDPEAVISFQNALARVKEFLDTGERPGCIGWQEL